MMKQIFIYTLIICLLAFTGLFNRLHAQNLFFLFGHAQYSAPVDKNFKENYNLGAGIEGGGGFGVNRTFLTATTGYSFFNARHGKGVGNLSYVPLKIGIRQYILPLKLVFIHADAGVAFLNSSSMGAEKRFAADIGAALNLKAFELGAAYEGFTRPGSETSGFSSWIGFKVGWRFGL